uniref:CHHC U11-48K-type domain-containing protein n=1 Tax=Podarcis muralis TaxID=64176 RepID=A0A670KE80_PODMU
FQDTYIYEHSMQPERFVQCPSNKNHQIRAYRLKYQLVKCRKNNQKVARELAMCPCNAHHQVPKRELELHIATCENKVSPEVLEVTASRGDPNNRIKEVTAWQCPPPEEDWDADESPAPPFVFGTRGSPTFISFGKCYCKGLGTILRYSGRLPMVCFFFKKNHTVTDIVLCTCACNLCLQA